MKRTVSILVIVAMLLASIVAILPIIATEAEPGTPDEVVTEGTAINDINDWMELVVKAVDESIEGVYYLNADIATVPLGNFKGTLYGNGHTITASGAIFSMMDGATVQDLKIEYVGETALFGEVKNESTIKNVSINMTSAGTIAKSLESSTVENVKATVLAGGDPIFGSSVNGSKIKDVTVTASGVKEITANPDGKNESFYNFGAFATTIKDSRLEDIDFTYAVKASGVQSFKINMGGFCATVGGTVIFENVKRSGDILLNTWGIHSGTSATYIGGFVADTEAKADVTFINCENAGNVISTQTMANVGGILARLYNSSAFFENCTNNGTIMTTCETSQGHLGVGGILGATENTKDMTKTIYFSGCVNNGTVAQTPIDQVVAARTAIKGADAALTDEDKACESIGGDCVHAGGIVGRAFGIPHLSLNSCVNNANITFTHQASDWGGTGGIVGHLMTIGDWEGVTQNYFSVVNCYNEGDITGISPGGIVGGLFKQLKVKNATFRLEHCVNAGDINGKVGRRAGGIVCGFDSGMVVTDIMITNCANYGNISGATYAGGITSTMPTGLRGNTTPKFSNCYNAGDITTKSYQYEDNNGKTVVTEDNAAGIAAAAIGASVFENCANIGKITSEAANKAFPITSNDVNVTASNCSYLNGCASGTFKYGVGKTENDLKAWANAMAFRRNNNNLSIELAIANAEALLEIDYTKASWKVLSDALAAAKAASADATKSQEAVDAAKATLDNAVTALSPVAAVFTVLDTQLTAYDKLDEYDWRSDSWLILVGKVEAGLAVKEQPGVLQSQVNAAAKEIETAIAGLVVRPQSTTLPLMSDLSDLMGDLYGTDAEETDPVTEAPTDSGTEAPTEPAEEGGCGGIIGGAVVVVAAVAAIGAGIAFKKKED